MNKYFRLAVRRLMLDIVSPKLDIEGNSNVSAVAGRDVKNKPI